MEAESEKSGGLSSMGTWMTELAEADWGSSFGSGASCSVGCLRCFFGFFSFFGGSAAVSGVGSGSECLAAEEGRLVLFLFFLFFLLLRTAFLAPFFFDLVLERDFLLFLGKTGGKRSFALALLGLEDDFFRRGGGCSTSESLPAGLGDSSRGGVGRLLEPPATPSAEEEAAGPCWSALCAPPPATEGVGDSTFAAPAG